MMGTSGGVLCAPEHDGVNLRLLRDEVGEEELRSIYESLRGTALNNTKRSDVGRWRI